MSKNLEIINKWLKQYKNKKTYRSYKLKIMIFNDFLIVNNLDILKINRSHLLHFKFQLINKHNINDYYAYRILNLVKLMCFDLFNEAIIQNDVTKGVKNIEYCKKTVDRYVISNEQFIEIVALTKIYITNEKFRNRFLLIIKILFYTGIRIFELANLKNHNIVFKRSGCWLSLIGKGGGMGDIPFPVKLISELNIAEVLNEPSIYLVAKYDNTAYSTNGLRKIIKKGFSFIQHHTDILLPLITPHTFRRSYATFLYDSKLDIRYIKQNLRHLSISTTFIYIQNDESQRYLNTISSFGNGSK